MSGRQEDAISNQGWGKGRIFPQACRPRRRWRDGSKFEMFSSQGRPMARNCIIGLLSIVITLGFGSLGYASDLSDCDRNASSGKIAAAAGKNPAPTAEAIQSCADL